MTSGFNKYLLFTTFSLVTQNMSQKLEVASKVCYCSKHTKESLILAYGWYLNFYSECKYFKYVKLMCLKWNNRNIYCDFISSTKNVITFTKDR